MIEVETIDRIVGLDGGGLPVVSLYVQVEADRRRAVDSQLASLLDQIRPLAYDGSLDREARLSVRGDIEHIQRSAREQRWRPGTMSIFSCSGRGLFEELELPRRIHDQVVVDRTPWVRPMLAVLDEYSRACVVLIDKGSARVFELYQNEMSEHAALRDETLRKPNFAYGRSEHRVHNRAEELANRHYRAVVDLLERSSRSYDVLVVAGHEYEVPGFVEFLSPELRKRLAGTFAIDPVTAALADIKRSAGSVLDRYEREQERVAVEEILSLNSMGGLAATGLTSCLWAGTVGAVQHLLVQEGAVRPGVVCDESNWFATSGDTCPLCGRAPRRTHDVIDELISAVIFDGATIKHVQAQTPLEQHIVAARLRFPLPPGPTL
jgi:peptide subunit release factor 1 (eRF1)